MFTALYSRLFVLLLPINIVLTSKGMKISEERTNDFISLLFWFKTLHSCGQLYVSLCLPNNTYKYVYQIHFLHRLSLYTRSICIK